MAPTLNCRVFVSLNFSKATVCNLEIRTQVAWLLAATLDTFGESTN